MKTHIKITLAMAFLAFKLSSLSRAELFIESEYPNAAFKKYMRRVSPDIVKVVKLHGIADESRWKGSFTDIAGEIP